MSAYLIVDINITDVLGYQEYKDKVPDVHALFGGNYLVRGGATKVLEGDWHPNRLVVLEFPDMASLASWYDSPEYAALKEVRKNSAITRLIAVEGVRSATIGG